MLSERAGVIVFHTDTIHSKEQATGIERFELMGKVEGVDVFDMQPLEADRLGTLEQPIEVFSYVRHFIPRTPLHC